MKINPFPLQAFLSLHSVFCLMLVLGLSVILKGQHSAAASQRWALDQSLEHKQWKIMLQDHKGFLWGYDREERAVFRYDGWEAHYFVPDSRRTGSISDCAVVREPYFMWQDKQRHIWIGFGTSCELARYDYRTDKWSAFSERLQEAIGGPYTSIYGIFQNGDNHLLISTRDYVLSYDCVRDSLSTFSEKDLFTLDLGIRKQGYNIIPDGDGKGFWFGSRSEAVHWNGEEVDTSIQLDSVRVNGEPLPIGLGKTFIFVNQPSRCMNMEIIHRGDRYVYLWVRDVFFSPETLTFLPVDSLLPNGESLAKFWVNPNNQELYLLSFSGRVFRFDKQDEGWNQVLQEPQWVSNHLFGHPDSISILSFLVTAQEECWVSKTTNNNWSCFKIAQKSGFPFFHFQPYPSNQQRLGGVAVYPDQITKADGTVYFNTYSGLQPIREQEKATLQIPFPDNRPYTFKLREGKRGQLWVPRNHNWPKMTRSVFQMTRYDIQADSIDFFTIAPKDTTDQLAHDLLNWSIADLVSNQEDTCWFGIANKVYYYDRSTHSFHRFLDSLTLGVIHTLYLTSDDHLLLGQVSNGLTTVDLKNGTWSHYSFDSESTNSLPHNTITSIAEDKKGTIWIGTEAGLCTLNRETNIIDRVPSSSIPHPFIYSLQTDEKGRVWITSRMYVTVFDPDEDRFFTFDLSQKVFPGKFYGFFPFHEGFRDDEGYLFFEGFSGSVYFHPDSIAFDSFSTPPILLDFQINNQNPEQLGVSLETSIADMEEAIRLPYRLNSLSFGFTSVNHRHPSDLQFAYRLEPYDEEWQQIDKNRQATYTKLPPGDYTFKVKSGNGHGIWHSQMATVDLHIKPPWWQTWWAYALYTLFFASIGIALYRFQLRRKLAQAEAQRLRELDEFKSQLYTNLTHEFRTPLTVILGMVDQVVDAPGEWFSEGMDMIRRNARRLLHLVNQMLDLARLEAGGVHPQSEDGDLVQFFGYLVNSFASLAASKKIELDFITSHTSLPGRFDSDQYQKIFSNLISNAIKFTDQGGEVALTFDKVGNRLHVTIRDNGRGIPASQLPYIFDRFYQVERGENRSQEGTGIGLALARQLVILNGGEIQVLSELHQGTTFMVDLPYLKAETPLLASDYETEKIKTEAFLPVDATGGENPSVKEANHRDKVLIVEDNPDVVAYLKSCLQQKFELVTATNGEEGKEQALETIPDLIISDVMMPVMDGFALCAALKKDRRTDHIPIILLTAKADKEARLKGFGLGVDAYLPKPFEKDELLLRIRTIIANRKVLQQKYLEASIFPVDPNRVKAVIGNEFLASFRNLVIENMDDPTLDMQRLEKALLMDRTQIFRKIKALTGLSPTQLIRSIRLEKSKTLLTTTDLSISQVALSVGFTSGSSFSTAFSKKFGKSPSVFRKTT